MTTTLDPSTVATMQGRELDAAIHAWLIGTADVRLSVKDITVAHVGPLSHCNWVPHYSTDPAAFFAVLERVREAGWEWESHHSGEKVVLYGHGRTLYGYGDTLPLAFARAALLTTIPNGGAS